MARMHLDPEALEWVSPEEYARRKAIRTGAHNGPMSDLPCPRVLGDLPAYESPIDGRMIEGRVARREDLKRSGCREVDPSEWKGAGGQKYLNREWAAKRGLISRSDE